MLADNWALFAKLDFVALATELNRLDGRPPVTLAEVETHVAQDDVDDWLGVCPSSLRHLQFLKLVESLMAHISNEAATKRRF